MWQQLLEVISPPADPVRPGTDDDWLRAVDTFGRPFPNDYRALIQAYGEGIFADFLYVCTPFSPHAGVSLFSVHAEVRQIILEYARDTPFIGLVEEDKLVCWGQTLNGDSLFWVDHGDPDAWKVVVTDAKWTGWSGYGLTAVEFLASLFQKLRWVPWFPRDLLKGSMSFSPREDWEEW
jgi:hypothetical protein